MTVKITFDSDMTLRWACRQGDYVFWARLQGTFATHGPEYRVADIWKLHDGDFITLTNRVADLPAWFDLHPLEVSGSLVWWMKKRLDEGYGPGDPIDGPNLWRVFAGDRIVWAGPSRRGAPSSNGILGLVEFNQNALVYGEPLDVSSGFPRYGAFERDELEPEGVRLCRLGWEAVLRSGAGKLGRAISE
ncbi:MAG: hypothetical protein AB1761_17020 [Pseudomonadota bacterium]